MIEVDAFLAAGYKKFSKSAFKPYAEFGLQKCIRDDIGKKYFITVWVYPELKERNLPQEFAPDFQLTRKGKATLNIEILLDANTTIQDIEADAEMLWKSVGAEYYERYIE